MKININHLYQFFLAAREGSIKQAAKILHVTEPTVSKQIRDLEEFIDIPLFDRVHRRLKLTPQGQAVVEKAEKIFHLVTELEFDLGKKNLGKSNNLAIGTVSLVQHKAAWALQKKFLRGNECTFTFRQGCFDDLRSDLEGQKIDIIIADHPYVSGPDFKTFRITPAAKLVAVVGKKYQNTRGRVPYALNCLPFIAMDARFKLQQDLDYYCQIKGIKLQKHLELQCPNLIKEAAILDHGLAILPQTLVAKDLEEQNLFKLGDINFLSLECWLIALSARTSESMIRRFVASFIASEKREAAKKAL